MNIGSIYCDYIYTTYLVSKAAFEVYLPLAKLYLDNLTRILNSILTTFNQLISATIDLIKAVLNNTKISLQSPLNKKFCNNLFRCNAFIENIINPNSSINTILGKFINIDSKVTSSQTEMYKIINDFKTFSNVLCDNTIAFTVSISALNSTLTKCKQQLKSFYKWIQKKILTINKHIQKYIKYLQSIDIFGYLDQFKLYFNCVLTDDLNCTVIHTVNSYYNDCLSKLHIKANANDTGYTIDDETKEAWLGDLTSSGEEILKLEEEVNDILKSLSDTHNNMNKSEAYDIFNNCLGGMSLKDIRNGNWTKHSLVKYVKTTTENIYNIFKNHKDKDGNPAPIIDDSASYMGLDFYINDISLDDLTGKIYYKGEYIGEGEFESVKTSSQDYYMNTIAENNTNKKNAIIVNNEIISVLAAAILMNDDDVLKSDCKSQYDIFKTTISEDNLMTKMG